jgi:hypothetical protein
MADTFDPYLLPRAQVPQGPPQYDASWLNELTDQYLKGRTTSQQLSMTRPLMDPRTGQPSTDPQAIMQEAARRQGLNAQMSNLPWMMYSKWQQDQGGFNDKVDALHRGDNNPAPAGTTSTSPSSGGPVSHSATGPGGITPVPQQKSLFPLQAGVADGTVSRIVSDWSQTAGGRGRTDEHLNNIIKYAAGSLGVDGNTGVLTDDQRMRLTQWLGRMPAASNPAAARAQPRPQGSEAPFARGMPQAQPGVQGPAGASGSPAPNESAEPSTAPQPNQGQPVAPTPQQGPGQAPAAGAEQLPFAQRFPNETPAPQRNVQAPPGFEQSRIPQLREEALLLRSMAQRLGTEPPVPGSKPELKAARIDAINKRASAVEEEMARIQKFWGDQYGLTEKEKDLNPAVRQAAITAKVNDKLADESIKRYAGLNASSEQYLGQGKNDLDLLQGVLDDPQLYSGLGHEEVLFWNRFKEAIGGDPTGARLQEMQQKLTAQNTLQLIDAQKNQMAASGEQSGRMFAQQINLVTQAIARGEATLGGNRMIAEIQQRIGEQGVVIARMAQDHLQNHALLDSSFDRRVADYLQHHPLFTQQELRHTELISPPLMRTPQQAADYAKRYDLPVRMYLKDAIDAGYRGDRHNGVRRDGTVVVMPVASSRLAAPEQPAPPR